MILVKKILLTVLCIQVLLPNDLLQNIASFPLLVAHYFHHNEEKKSIQFIHFMEDHYSNEKHHDEDHDDHNKLPFHNHDFNCQHSIFTTAVLDNSTTLIANYPVANSKTKIVSRQHFYSSTSLSSIWRPPKSA